jgi:hypothetical protein
VIILASKPHLHLKLSGGSMAQCLGLINGLVASQKLSRPLKISYYPYSTGTYWPFAIKPLLSSNEILDLGVGTRGLKLSKEPEVGKILTEHPLMTKNFSYEKLLSLLRRLRLEPLLQFMRRELAVMGTARRIIDVNGYYRTISGGFAVLNVPEVNKLMHQRFQNAKLKSPFSLTIDGADSVVIHYRLGDKKAAGHHPSDFNTDAIIDPKAFAEVLKDAGLQDHKNITVVSDEPLLAKSLLSQVNIKANISSKTGSIWDDLYIMSQASFFIGSNSQVSKFASICVENNGGKSYLLNVDNQESFYNFSNITFVKAAIFDLENMIYSLDFDLEENAHSAYKQ